MQKVTEVNIQDYIDLYNEGLKLDEIKPLQNATYRLFKSSGLDIRIVHRSASYSDPKAYEKMKHFGLQNDYFYMIPITTIKGTIVGFIVRAVLKHDYNTISRTFSSYYVRVPLMYGFDKSFLTYDKRSAERGRCYPIIVCEGSKDCMMLKRFYPYVVANNTSSMGINAQVLRTISNSFILAYDNDKAGAEGMERDKKVLRGLGAYVDSLKLHEGIKDCAEYLDHPKEFKELKSQIRRKIEGLLST